MVVRIILLVKLEFWEEVGESGGGRSCRCDSSATVHWMWWRWTAGDRRSCTQPLPLEYLIIAWDVAQARKHVRIRCEGTSVLIVWKHDRYCCL